MRVHTIYIVLLASILFFAAPSISAHSTGSSLTATLQTENRANPVLILTNQGSEPCKIASTALGTITITRLDQQGKEIDAVPIQVGFEEDPALFLQDQLEELAPAESLEIPLPVSDLNSKPALRTIVWSPEAGSFGALYPFSPDTPYQLALTYSIPLVEVEGPPLCGSATATTGSTLPPLIEQAATVPWWVGAAILTSIILILILLIWIWKKRRSPGTTKTKKSSTHQILKAVLIGSLLAGLAATRPVSADYTVPAGDEGAFNECMDTFNSHPDITGPILDALGRGTIVIETNRDRENYATDYPDGSYHIHWDPESVYNYHSDGGTITSTPCDRLFHEMYHVYEMMNGTFNRAPCGSSGIETKEVTATRAQNQLREALGLPPRTHYGDTPLPTGDCSEPAAPSDCTGSDCGSSRGDPHLKTFDTLRYSFQAAGEFILAKSTVDTFEVQVRQQPWLDSRTVAVTTAVSMRNGTDRIELHLQNGSPILLINGSAQTITKRTLPAGGTVSSVNGRKITVTWPDGTTVVTGPVGSLNLDITVNPSPERVGKLEGLLGNYNAETADDLVIRGTTETVTPAFESLYPRFADSWRVTPESSLFTYSDGTSTETYTDRRFPYQEVTADTVPNRAFAEAVCTAMGVIDPVSRENCIIDVASTGRPEFAASALADQQAAAITRDDTGEAITLTTEEDDTARASFDATAGEQVFVDLINASATSRCGTLLLFNQAGDRIATGCIINGRGSIDTTELPESGRYTISIANWSEMPAARLRLIRVQDQSIDITPDGPVVEAQLATPGMKTIATFQAEAGQNVFIEATESTLPSQCGGLKLLSPEGKTLKTGCIIGSSGSINTTELPERGTYSVVLDPSDRDVGSAKLRLYAISNLEESITIGGSAVQLQLDKPGTSARLNFTGTAGQTVFIEVTDNTLPGQCGGFALIDAAGERVANGCILGATGSMEEDGIALPADGRYTILIDPSDEHIGSLKVRVRE